MERFAAKWIVVFLTLAYGVLAACSPFFCTCPLAETIEHDHDSGGEQSHDCSPDIHQVPAIAVDLPTVEEPDGQTSSLQPETTSILPEAIAPSMRISYVFLQGANAPPPDAFPSNTQGLRGPPVV